MMTQEEFMDVLAMKRRGMSFKEIGDELGYHPATIAKWVKAGGPPPARTVDEAEPHPVPETEGVSVGGALGS